MGIFIRFEDSKSIADQSGQRKVSRNDDLKTGENSKSIADQSGHRKVLRKN